MDLDDSFTEQLLLKKKARDAYIYEKKGDMLSVGKKRAALVDELQLNADNLPREESPKRQCTEALNAAYFFHNKENVDLEDDSEAAFIPIHTASKVRGLAALKKHSSSEEMEIPKVTSGEQVNKCNTYYYSTNSDNLCTKQKSRFANLAADIRQWEDGTHRPTLSSNVASVKETPTSIKSPVKPVSEFLGNGINKNLHVNENSDDEASSDDESIDENDFAENYDCIKSDNENKMEIESPVKQIRKEHLRSEFVKAEEIERPVLPETSASNVDPAELPLSARKALFEKALLGGAPKLNETADDNKLSVAQRAAMFENASKFNSGAKVSNFKGPSRIAISKFTNFEKNGVADVRKSPVKADVKPITEIKASPVKKILPEAATTSALSPTKNIGNHTRLIHQKLIESTGCTSRDKEVVKVVEERKKEISSLVNHWEKLSSSSSVENNSEGKNNSVPDERILYESDAALEDVDEEESESEESYEENADEEVIINNDVAEEEMFEENGNNNVAENEEFDNGENVFFTQENEMESAKGEEESSEQNGDSVSISSQNYRSEVSSISGRSSYTDDSNYNASHSGSCSSGSSVGSYNVYNSTPDDELEKVPKTNQEKTNPEIPLLYTVSFYRKQKQTTKLTPVRTIVRREKVSSPESPPDVDYTEIIQQRLKALQDEVLRQQTVISQTSQALNLCSATAEFSGSTEQVEGERLLLIATQKRQACLNEITRLKTCGAQGENVVDGAGTLTITDLELPLKREFVASQLEGKGNDTVHYFLCLIRYGAQVMVTQMMSSDDRSSNGTLSFTNHIQLRDLPANFSVVFEVYALQTKKECLPHEKKYHIKREHSKLRLTPKGRKLDNKMPAVSSPGGPNAVRSPSFGVVGFTRFTLQNSNKRTFTLDKVPFTSPLDGVLRVSLQLHAENKIMEKGFLTMFEDISGFGAWQRRWWALDAHRLTFWKYPDDENRKEPIGSIDLRQCITDVVKLVSRDVCARPHTFQLVTVRPSQKGDRDTLVTRSVNTLTTTKHLLSADTKDERIMWCNKLNEALTNIRKWDPQALRPIDSSKLH